MMRRLDLVEIAGGMLVAAGLAVWWLPVGLAVGGVMAIAWANLRAMQEREPAEPEHEAPAHYEHMDPLGKVRR